MLDTEVRWKKRTTEQKTTKNMKPQNTNVEIMSSGDAELKVSFIHKEVNPNHLDLQVFIGWKKSDSEDHYFTLAEANVQVYIQCRNLYGDIAKNPKSTWEKRLINLIYDSDPNQECLRPTFKHLEELEWNPAPFFILHSISIVPARMDEIMHVFFQAFFRQYPFGIILVAERYDDSMSEKDKQDLKNTLKNYGFESIDKVGAYKYLEYEPFTESIFTYEDSYYDKNLVLWTWFKNDCTQDIIRDLD